MTNFAAQAVIAIENTRLLNELRQRTDDLSEALEQQTATSEVLKIISASPAELQSVFQATIDNATRLCGAKFGALSLREGDVFRNMANIALHGVRPAYFEERLRDPIIRPTPGHNLERLLRTKAVVHIPDLASDVDAAQVLFERAGARALLNVPLLKDNDIIGSIMVYREEPGAFTDKQIELVQNFAAQAVIAIENTRLLNELRQRTDDLTESLTRQTATSEVLRVISSSPGNLEPVFQAILENATRICGADFGTMSMFDGRVLRPAALHNVPSSFADLRQRDRAVPLMGTPAGKTVETKQVVHFADVSTIEPYSSAPLVKHTGARSIVSVPLLKEGTPVGVVTIYRTEVRPFTDKQIELVQNFAAQAVIAIENTRLLNELRESLQQQTATSQVLSVISSSPGDLMPIFQSLLENATHICGAKFGVLWLREGDLFRAVAAHGGPPAYREILFRAAIRPSPDTGLGMLLKRKRFVQIDDITKGKAYLDRDPLRVATVELAGGRTLAEVPLLKDGELIGSINIYHQEVKPFTEKQIELLTGFAAQAVIAIENTRLLNELRQRTDDLSESLEQQTATSEVLKVISSSPGDLKPVFEAMLDNAVRICGAKFGTLFRFDGERFHTNAYVGAPQAYIDYQTKRGPFVPPPGAPLDHLLKKKEVVRTIDMSARQTPVTPFVEFAGTQITYRRADAARRHTGRRDRHLRQEVRPFTDKQIELVQNFAAQAVIAIENTRLLNELRESLQQQTATADVLKVISRSTFDLQTVLDTLVESAARLCEADMASITRKKAAPITTSRSLRLLA